MIVPAMLLPYLALFTLATVFLSTKTDFFGYIMESVFNSNAWLLLTFFALCCSIAGAFDIIFAVLSIREKRDAVSLAKAAMLIKLIQIPAYTLIFVLGGLLTIAILTIPFSIGLFLFDCLSVLLTGAVVVIAGVNSIRQGTFKLKDVLPIMILQLVFCADVVSSVIFYVMLKNAAHKAAEQNTPTVTG